MTKWTSELIEEYTSKSGEWYYEFLKFTSVRGVNYVVTCWKNKEGADLDDCHFWLEFSNEENANKEMERWRGT